MPPGQAFHARQQGAISLLPGAPLAYPASAARASQLSRGLVLPVLSGPPCVAALAGVWHAMQQIRRSAAVQFHAEQANPLQGAI